MEKHVKIYLAANGFDQGDFIPCENCKAPAVDIHHIEARGMGGSKTKDFSANLIALCRACHIRAHAEKEFNLMLKSLK